MTLRTDEPRTELVEITSVQNGMSRDGMTEQYVVSYKWDYSLHPAIFYITKSIAPEFIANFDGRPVKKVVKIKQMYLKNSQSGGKHDGSQMYHYQWEALTWEEDNAPISVPPVAVPSPTITQPSQPSQPPQQVQPPVQQGSAQLRPVDDVQVRIMRQSALKCATWLLVPSVNEKGIDETVNKSMEIANKFLEYFLSGDVPDEIADLWEMD